MSLATKQLELLNAILYLPKGRKETPPEVTKTKHELPNKNKDEVTKTNFSEAKVKSKH